MEKLSLNTSKKEKLEVPSNWRKQLAPKKRIVMPGQRVTSKYQICPQNNHDPVIAEAGEYGVILQRTKRIVTVKFDNGNICQCDINVFTVA